jgi:predicted HD phosphohydrolase
MAKKSKRILVAVEPEMFRRVAAASRLRQCSAGTIVRQALVDFFSSKEFVSESTHQ